VSDCSASGQAGLGGAASVGLGRTAPHRVGSGRVGSGRVGLGWLGCGASGRAASGRAARFRATPGHVRSRRAASGRIAWIGWIRRGLLGCGVSVGSGGVRPDRFDQAGPGLRSGVAGRRWVGAGCGALSRVGAGRVEVRRGVVDRVCCDGSGWSRCVESRGVGVGGAGLACVGTGGGGRHLVGRAGAGGVGGRGVLGLGV
jgi:hypothetical protein